MSKPESYKAYDQVAHPSAGGTMAKPDSETDALGKPHKQNQTNFVAEVRPDSVLKECREKQLGSNGYQGN